MAYSLNPARSRLVESLGDDLSFTELLKKTPAAVRSTVKAARRAVKRVAPKAKEIAYRNSGTRSGRSMWKLVRYVAEGDDEYAVAIGTYPDHVSLFFPHGRELDDGTGLLEGSGKRFRFITLRSPGDADRPEVTKVLRKALSA